MGGESLHHCFLVSRAKCVFVGEVQLEQDQQTAQLLLDLALGEMALWCCSHDLSASSVVPSGFQDLGTKLSSAPSTYADRAPTSVHFRLYLRVGLLAYQRHALFHI